MPTNIAEIEEILRDHDLQFQAQPSSWRAKLPFTKNCSGQGSQPPVESHCTSAIPPKIHPLKTALEMAQILNNTDQKKHYLTEINRRIAQLLQEMMRSIGEYIRYPIQKTSNFTQERRLFLDAKNIDDESTLLFDVMQEFVDQLLNPDIPFAVSLKNLRKLLNTELNVVRFPTHVALLKPHLEKLKIHLHQILDQYDASALALLQETVLKIDSSQPLPASFNFDALLQDHPDQKRVALLKTTENYRQLQQLFCILKSSYGPYKQFSEACKLYSAMTGAEKIHLGKLFNTYEYIAFQQYLSMLKKIDKPAEQKIPFSPYFSYIEKKKHFIAAQEILKHLGEPEALADHMLECVDLLKSIEVPFFKNGKQDPLIQKIKSHLDQLMQQAAIKALSTTLTIAECISGADSVLEKISLCKKAIECDRTLCSIIHTNDYKAIVAIFSSLLTASVPFYMTSDYLTYSQKQCETLVNETLKHPLDTILKKFQTFIDALINKVIDELNEKEPIPALIKQRIINDSNYKFIKHFPDIKTIIDILTCLETKKTPMLSGYQSFSTEAYLLSHEKNIQHQGLKTSVARIIRKTNSTYQDEHLAEAVVYLKNNEPVQPERSQQNRKSQEECFIESANDLLQQIKTDLTTQKPLCSRYLMLFFYFKVKIPYSVAKGVECIAAATSKEENFSIGNEGVVKAKNFISKVDTIVTARQKKQYGLFRHRSSYTQDFYQKYSAKIEELRKHQTILP